MRFRLSALRVIPSLLKHGGMRPASVDQEGCCTGAMQYFSRDEEVGQGACYGYVQCG